MPLLQCLLREFGQHKGGRMHLRAVILEQFVFLFGADGAQRRFDVSAGIFAANHEADLAGGVGRNRGPAVLSHRKNLLA